MKKKAWIPILVAVLLAVLLIPVPGPLYKDGGTRAYTALTYKIVDWNRMMADRVYENTAFYLFPRNFQSLDTLWELEQSNVGRRMTVTVLDVQENSVTVSLADGGENYRFRTDHLPAIGARPGLALNIICVGAELYTDPAQIQVVDWEISGDQRHEKYKEQWLDKKTAERYDAGIFDDVRITEIYSNCFFARTVIPMPYTVKVNGSLSDDWCVGDQVYITYENTYYDMEHQRVEVDLLTVAESTFQPDPNACYKPVIYLYPEKEIPVSVKLALDGELTCTYPAYQNGWNVTAAPDGTLTDATGQTYNYLYWEGLSNVQWDMTWGFCVKGSDTAAFLEDALEKLGLTRREANEFIVFWLPLMQENPYNRISFQTDVYADAAKLSVYPEPDTLIRVFMTWQGVEEYVPMAPQTLTAPERTGFTVVEWGGTKIGN